MEGDPLLFPVIVILVNYRILSKVACSAFISSLISHHLIEIAGSIEDVRHSGSSLITSIELIYLLMSVSFFYVSAATLFGAFAKLYQRCCSIYRGQMFSFLKSC